MTTNYERIKAMSVDEMAEFFVDCTSCEMCPRLDLCADLGTTVNEYKQVIKQWLESEAENDR
jgi:hypothetical protein